MKNWPEESLPRRAALSSLGIGGTNAHAILEEYQEVGGSAGLQPDLCHSFHETTDSNQADFLIPLSAKNDDRVYVYAETILAFLRGSQNEIFDLRDLSFTLQTGREAMKSRVIFIVHSLNDLINDLEDFTRKREAGGSGPAFTSPPPGNTGDAFQENDEASHELVCNWIANGKLKKLAEFWAKGGHVDWNLLYEDREPQSTNDHFTGPGDGRPHRISLPTYPFAQKRYSIKENAVKDVFYPSQLQLTETPKFTFPSLRDKPSKIRLYPLAEEQNFSIQAAKVRETTDCPDNPEKLLLEEKNSSRPSTKTQRISESVIHDLPLSMPSESLPVETLQKELIGSLAKALYMEQSDVDIDKPFIDMGLDSIVGVEWVRAINDKYKLNITTTKIYTYPSIQELAVFLEKELNRTAVHKQNKNLVRKLDKPDLIGQRSVINQETSHHALSSYPIESLREELASSLAKALYMKRNEIDLDKPFVEMGLNSIIGVEWTQTINKKYSLNLTASKIYDYPTVQEFAGFLKKELDKSAKHEGASIQTPGLHSEIKPPRQDLRNPSEYYGLVLSTVHSFNQISLGKWKVPDPSHDEVTIRVKASAVNFPDAMCVKGLYPTMPDYPFVPGFEVSGIVSKVGDQVSKVKVGDEVIAMTGKQMGGHAGYVNVPADNFVLKPKNISFEEACSLPVVFGTVHYAFEAGKLAGGEHVLIQTATGGCGLMAIQLARLKRCVCYGTSSRSGKLDILKKLGVPHVINYKTSEFDQDIKHITNNRGVDVVLNMLSGDNIQRGLNCLGPSGRYLEIAVHGLKTSPKLNLSGLVQNQSIHSIDLRQLSFRQGDILGENMLNTMVSWLESEKIVPIVSRIYPIHQIVEALEYVSQGKHIGKVVISHTHQNMVDLTDQCLARLLEQKRNAETRFSSPKLTRPTEIMQTEENISEGVAIIGVSGQFPQSKTLDAFWENLCQGENCVSEIPGKRWPNDRYYDPNKDAPGKTYCKWMGVLEGVDQFDPLFFNISPAEAQWMAPQQRLFLKNALHCVENAGLNPASLSGSSCGVFVGCVSSEYGQSVNGQKLSA